jgi:glutathionyl-hydroquinone reductase
MKNLMKQIEAFLKEDISPSQFRAQVESNADQIIAAYNRGIYLKLKYGFRDTAREIFERSNPCPNCRELEEHKDQLEARIEEGKFQRTQKPSWADPLDFHRVTGPDAFYKCTGCGAIWYEVLPEKEFAGYVQRIG